MLSLTTQRCSGRLEKDSHSPSDRKPLRRFRVPVGARTIPNSLADTPCAQMTVTDLLTKLNSITGESRELRGSPSLRRLLEHIRTTARDFGEAYGILRPWWWGSGSDRRLQDPSTALKDMEERRLGISSLRNGAIRESRIEDSHIPPRRVWDLYSNRVLPYHVLPETNAYYNSISDELWTVSHSWAADGDRAEVWTNINGQQWPVPIPRGTTLDHVRIELLNMNTSG